MSRAGAATLLAIVAAFAGIAPAMPASGATTSSDAIALTVMPDATSTGGWVQVVATGVRPGTLVVVELCGSADTEALETCDESTVVNAVADTTGTVSSPFLVHPPSAGCPCSVHLSSADRTAQFEIAVPLTVDGIVGEVVGTLSPSGRDPTALPLRVVHAELSGGGPWTAWFGARPERTLHYTVQNAGDSPVADGRVELRAGTDGTGQMLPTPPIGLLKPGERRSFQVQVGLEPLAWGDYEVTGMISSRSQPLTFSARTTTYPWGLIALTILVVEMLVIGARRWLRRRAAINPLEEDPDLPRRVSELVSAATILDRRAPEIGRDVAGCVVASLSQVDSEHSG